MRDKSILSIVKSTFFNLLPAFVYFLCVKRKLHVRLLLKQVDEKYCLWCLFNKFFIEQF